MKKIETKINNKKVIFNNIAGERIICEGKKTNFVELYVQIKCYLKFIKELSSSNGLSIDIEKVNKGVSFIICGKKINVKTAFELYGEIRKKYKLDYECFTELIFDGKRKILVHRKK